MIPRFSARLIPAIKPAILPVRRFARPAVHLMRELSVHSEGLGQRGRGPLAAFLPAYGPQGAALLRIYHIARALRQRGWATLVLPATLTLAQRHRVLARSAPRVLVMQGARHALNRPALYPGIPVLFDMDDADFHLPHLAGAVQRAMPDVSAVIAGSRYVADWCRHAGAGAAHVVWTGTPVSRRPRRPHSARGPVVAWAQTRPQTYTREAALVAKIMRAAAARHTGLTLRLYDRRPEDDPGFADMFAAPGLTVEWRKTSRYSDYLGSFDDVSLGLAPLSLQTPFSRGKSFGKVLAYLDRGVPVIASNAGEHARFFTPDTGVIADDPEAWSAAVTRLMAAPEARQSMADRAYGDFKKRLSLEAATGQTDAIMRGLIAT